MQRQPLIYSLVILVISMCLFSTVEASGPYSEKAKAQYAARVQKAKERNARIHAFYVARLKAYKAMLSKCKKCRSFICNR